MIIDISTLQQEYSTFRFLLNYGYLSDSWDFELIFLDHFFWHVYTWGMEKIESNTVIVQTTHRPWGSFTNLYEASNHKVKKIEVSPGARLSLQSHKHRKEHWIVVQGEAIVTLDNIEKKLTSGDYIFIPLGSVHRLQNIGSDSLVLIEVQLGSYLGEDDIVRYQDDYQRT